MTAAERAAAVRESVGLFSLEDRGLIEVSGADRVRWLNGQISNDVATLEPGSGCYATVLTVKGAIISDMHVLVRADAFWLGVQRDTVASVLERLDRYIVADDVELTDRSDHFARCAIEGPRASELLSAVGVVVDLERDAWKEVSIADTNCVLASFGGSNLDSYQLFIDVGSKAKVLDALRDAGSAVDLVEGDAETLEVLRVESGVPRTGSELDEEVFPAEARLDRAISTTKGCYTGQEIVERIRSRGQVHYLLVGLRLAPDGKASVDDTLQVEGKSVGELTSIVDSSLGRIALGYVRREFAEPGTSVQVAGETASVEALPFVSRGAASP